MNYAWMDLETTGTDEQAGSILEVGLIVTDLDLVEIAEHEWLVWAPTGALAAMPDVVRTMHEDNGLLDALTGSAGADVGTVDDEVRAVLDAHRDGHGQFILAGSGVGHFDSRWIRLHLPRTSQRLTYWTLDVGVVRRFLAKLCDVDLGDAPDKPHRALDDARLHLDEARRYRGMMRGALDAAHALDGMLPSADTAR